MKQLNALYFPETLPRGENLAPFLALCDTISFYALPSSGNASPPVPLPGHDRCIGYCPVPMREEDLVRFRHLIREIEGREGEFYHGLLSSFSPGNRAREEDAGWALAAALRAGEKRQAPESGEQEVIWRSMLVLKLAEMLAREEDEIARGLSAISARQAELLASIRGGDEDDEDEELDLDPGRESMSRAAARPERLAKAWASLYLRDDRASASRILAAAGSEMLDLLADAHAGLGGGAPEKLAVVALPDGQEETALFPGESGKRFRELLEEIAGTPTVPAGLREELAGLARAAERAGSPSLRTLTLYAFAGHSARRLFARLCNAPPDTGDRSGPVTAILAVLT